MLGAIDVGSNAIRFSVFRLNVRLTPILQSRKRYPIRLGAGTFVAGALADDDMDAAVEALREIARIARDQNMICLPAVATSAIREATNCDAFLIRVQMEAGIELKAITGDEEARLAARGVAFDMGSKRENLIVDIGGGSTEIIKVRPGGEIEAAVSLPIGAVRLAKHVGMPDIYEQDVVAKLRKMVKQTISNAPLDQFQSSQQTTCIGGTACALAAAVKSRNMAAPDSSIEIRDVSEITAELVQMTVSNISRTTCTDESRARLIIPGAIILTSVLDHMKVKEFSVSDAGVREGLISEFMETPSP